MNVISFDVVRAEQIIEDYCDGTTSREEAIAKLISAFNFGLDDAEIVMKEIDSWSNQ